jgi:hypothetical protein
VQANIDRSDNEDDEWVRSYHERLRQIRVVDALDGIPPCPRLPADLDDPVALDNWTAAWNAWIANEAVQLQRPLLKKMTPETLAGIVRAEKRARDHLAGGAQQREVAEATDALNAVEARLKATDPTYEGKRALLVPILKPIFKRLPPNQWAPAFEPAAPTMVVNDLSSVLNTDPELHERIMRFRHKPVAHSAWNHNQVEIVPVLRHFRRQMYIQALLHQK